MQPYVTRTISTISRVVTALALITACACSGNPQEQKQKYLASGDQYRDSGKLAEAVIEYRNAVQQDPGAGDARARLADAYLRTGNAPLALQEYVRAADLVQDDSSVQVRAGTLLLLAGRFDDARLWAEKVLAREPRNIEAQLLFANALAGLKDFDGAVAELEEAIKLNPSRGETYSNLGAFELRRGQKDAAERAFKKAIEIDERSVPARLALANFYWADSQWPAAEAELVKVLELDAKSVPAHRALASFYIATNRASEAEPHLKAVRDLTNSLAATFALADYYIARQDDAAARLLLTPVSEGSAGAALAEIRLASLDRRSGQKDTAYARLAQILEKDAANLEALLVKTAFLSADGRLEEALSSAELAADKHRESAAAQFSLGRVQAARHQIAAAIAAYEAVLRINPRATDAKIELSRLQLAARRPEASLALAREVAGAQPKNLQAKLLAARALLTQRDFKRAQVELDDLARQAPESASVQSLLGVLKGGQRDESGARKHFERALQLDPDSIEAVGGLIALELGAKRISQARALADNRLKRSERDSAVLMLAARTYAASGDLATAESLLRRTIEVDPGVLDAYGALAQLYVSQRRLPEALAEFEQLAKRQPRPVAALTFAGMILQGQGKNAEAQDRFKRALELDPEAPAAANNLAWLYAESPDNIDLALELAMRAKAKLPDSPQINDTIGWIHYKKGVAPEAIQYFEKSIEKDANNPVYHYHLGLAYAKAGDSVRARQSLERALAMKADFSDAGDAKRVLASLSQ